MKKFLALFLSLALCLSVLAACGVSAVEEEPKAPVADPYYALNWSAVDDRYDNIEDHYVITMVNKDGEMKLWRTGCGFDEEKILADMKKEMDSRPEEMRQVRIHNLHTSLSQNTEAHIFLDKDVEIIQKKMESFMERYYNMGGKLYGWVLDMEYIRLGSYWLSLDYKKNPDLFKEIVEHPLYAAEVRPALEERGFMFYTEDSYTPEIWGVYIEAASKYKECQYIWDAVMRSRINKYLTDAYCVPMWKYFPDAIASDYQSRDSYGWHKDLSNDGDPIYLGGNYEKVGNVSNYNSYAVHPSSNMLYEKNTTIEYRYPASYNKAYYADNPFNMALWDANFYRNMREATDTKMMSVWIIDYAYNSGREGSVSNTPYYTENLYHLGLLDPQPFLMWMNRPDYETDENYFEKMDVVSEIMDELTRVAGYSDRKPIDLPANWNNSFILSGMYANGRNIWRITPDTTSGMTKENFKIEGEDPTFYINGQTITFPGGKIIEDSKISVVGTCGYWVETDANVVPIISNAVDRYATNPSFYEGFENYAVDDPFNFATARPTDVWEIADSTQKNSVIVADKNDPSNQLLSLKGKVTVKNVRMPGNITAGDNYAKEQAWELTFTLPETMAEEGELVMLNFTANKLLQKDGGFKIAGGKVYYSAVVEQTVEGTTEENGEPKVKLVSEYQQMQDVTVAPGGTYTVKRILNLTDEEAYTSSYYLFDSEGVLVGKAEDVAIGQFTDAVQSISFSIKNFGEETLYFDDYKLYPVGFAAELEIYNAATGIEVDDIAVARDGQSAYRYAWMNASDKEEKVQIVAQVLDEAGKVVSETLIKELTMLPGCDGVETGIYDAGDTAVVFAVKNMADAEKDNSLWLYVGIGIAAAALIAVGAVLVIKKKKPNAK